MGNNNYLEVRREIQLNVPVSDIALSGNGQYVAVATENGLSVYSSFNADCFLKHPADQKLPLLKVAVTSSMGTIYIVTREGTIARINVLNKASNKWDVEVGRFFEAVINVKNRDGEERQVYDLYGLSLSSNGDMLAIGHHSPGLTVLDTAGEYGATLWQRHKNTGNATDGQGWSVDFSPIETQLYIASSGVGHNRVALMDASQRSVLSGTMVDDGVQVTAISVLPNQMGVATVQTQGRNQYRLVVYDKVLEKILWEKSFYQPITSMAANRESLTPRNAPEGNVLLAVSLGVEGKVMVLNALTGQVLSELVLRTLVNALDFVQGAVLAAATQDGSIFTISYISSDGFSL